MTETKDFHTYRIILETTRKDGRYHETVRTHYRIEDPVSGEIIHEGEVSDRSGHQLREGARSAADTTLFAEAEAQRWILANCPRAAEARDAAAQTSRKEATKRAREALAAMGGDELEFVLQNGGLVNVSDLGRILGLGDARRANRMLLGWGLQSKDSAGYWPVHHDHGVIVGSYAQLRWTPRGLKAAWDAAVVAGIVQGGDTEFLDRIRSETNWLDFTKEDV